MRHKTRVKVTFRRSSWQWSSTGLWKVICGIWIVYYKDDC